MELAGPRARSTVCGEVGGGLPRSQSVARAEGVVRNLGALADTHRTNCGGQAGRDGQRPEARPDRRPGARSVPSNPPQGPHGSEVGEGTGTPKQSRRYPVPPICWQAGRNDGSRSAHLPAVHPTAVLIAGMLHERSNLFATEMVHAAGVARAGQMRCSSSLRATITPPAWNSHFA